MTVNIFVTLSYYYAHHSKVGGCCGQNEKYLPFMNIQDASAYNGY